MLIIVFIKKGEIYASIVEEIISIKMITIISTVYLVKIGIKGSGLTSCIRIIRRENEMAATPIIKNAGTRIKFWGKTETSESKKPLNPI